MTRNRLRSIITGEDSWILRLLEINLWTLIRILFSCFQREFFSMGWEKNSSKVEAFIAVEILSGPRLVEETVKTRSAYRSLAAWTGGLLDLLDKEHVKTFWTGTVDESFVEESEQESPEFDEISEEIFKAGLNICENNKSEDNRDFGSLWGLWGGRVCQTWQWQDFASACLHHPFLFFFK